MRFISLFAISVGTIGLIAPEASARGFGVARAGGYARPGGGVAVGHSYAGAAAGPFGAAAGGARGGTYVGPRGSTVQHGAVGGAAVGPLGGVHAGGAQGTRVTTPGGRTFTTGNSAHAGVGPLGGVHAGASHGAAVGGPFGAAAVGGHIGGAIGPGGVAVGGARGAAVVGHGTRYWSGTALHTQAGYVRAGTFYHGSFNAGWYTAHPVAWRPVRWWGGASLWAVPVWTTVAPFVGVTVAPASYDYGSSVVIENNSVYFNGQEVGPADDYAQQAIDFADRGRAAKPAADDAWQPLGVFGVVQEGEKEATTIFQLGLNKQGVVRGNYYDAVADNTMPVYGSLDPKTQRVAWSIGDKKTVVFEAGLDNLTRAETTVLVHYGKDRTLQRVLVRLEEQKDDKSQSVRVP